MSLEGRLPGLPTVVLLAAAVSLEQLFGSLSCRLATGSCAAHAFLNVGAVAMLGFVLVTFELGSFVMQFEDLVADFLRG